MIHFHHHHQARLIHYLSGLDIIITAHDSMQNPGQHWIFYKPGQTHWTQTKHDLVDLDDLTRFQPWCKKG